MSVMMSVNSVVHVQVQEISSQNFICFEWITSVPLYTVIKPTPTCFGKHHVVRIDSQHCDWESGNLGNQTMDCWV